MHSKFVWTTLAAVGLAAAAGRVKRASGDTFSLFAYGPDIGGLPVFYENGTACIASYPTANATGSNLLPVQFTLTSGSGFSAAPNTTAPVSNNATGSPPISSATFFVPSGTASGPVGFTTAASAPSGEVATGFGFMGHVAYLTESDGSIVSSFYAVPANATGVWTLAWNEVSDSSAVPVTLKDTAPPNLITEDEN